MTEIWAPIPGQEGYQASTWGQVLSEARTVMRSGHLYRVRERILKQTPGEGAVFVKVGNKTTRVHKLILETFVVRDQRVLSACIATETSPTIDWKTSTGVPAPKIKQTPSDTAITTERRRIAVCAGTYCNLPTSCPTDEVGSVARAMPGGQLCVRVRRTRYRITPMPSTARSRR